MPIEHTVVQYWTPLLLCSVPMDCAQNNNKRFNENRQINVFISFYVSFLLKNGRIEKVRTSILSL
jgi:hypothetical protein